MLALAIDTATPAVTAGLVRLDGTDVRVLASRVHVDARAHAEVLTPLILDCLAESASGTRGPRRGGGRGGARAVHRAAGRHRHRRGVRGRARDPGARCVQPRRDRGRRAASRRRSGTVGRHRCPPPRGVLGALPRRAPPRRARGVPARRSRRRRGCVDRRIRLARRTFRPACGGGADPVACRAGARRRRCVAAGQEPEPPVPLYLRRPDAVERAVVAR